MPPLRNLPLDTKRIDWNQKDSSLGKWIAVLLALAAGMGIGYWIVSSLH